MRGTSLPIRRLLASHQHDKSLSDSRNQPKGRNKMNAEPTPVEWDQIIIDIGYNADPGADCPNCGEDYDIARGCVIGIAVRDGARLCTGCINASVPDLAAVLDVVRDLQYLIEDSAQPDLLAMASRQLVKSATEMLLYEIDWAATLATRNIHAVPSESA